MSRLLVLLVVVVCMMFSAVSGFSSRSFRKPSLMKSVLSMTLSSSATLATPVKLLGAEKLMASTDVFIFDCDGVIWKGDSIIKGVPEVRVNLWACCTLYE